MCIERPLVVRKAPETPRGLATQRSENSGSGSFVLLSLCGEPPGVDECDTPATFECYMSVWTPALVARRGKPRGAREHHSPKS
ncbi:hypothetical protein HPB50_026171 [Hyalomma asiaticum]|uniref:Uncharacterized protein n=1 Tax=Hyalomma asiaticum TaxID=266040 RepID=A0ACB7SJ25_HYAAI|nr:hypothetical protein HPB50_026171 [Hyalomma asiaticum]